MVVPSAWRTWATVSERVLRKVSAWALPRPSATASAKLANSTVNHNQIATSPMKTLSELRRGQVPEEQHRGPHAADQHDEHHRIAELLTRVELDEGVADGPAHDGRLEQRCARLGAHLGRPGLRRRSQGQLLSGVADMLLCS